MEIELVVHDEGLNDDFSREADALRRIIFKKYPNAVWEKSGEGHKIFV